MSTPDLDRYCERIGLRGRGAKPTYDLLAEVHLAHATSIPFENLDIHLGIPIRLEPEHVFDKLVARRRGGYCFEQNGLLLAMLQALGFAARPLAGRVTFGPPIMRPRTHMVVLVEIGDRKFLADVGFGTHNLLAPLPFEPDQAHELHGETYRLTPGHDVEVRAGDEWQPLYRLSLEEQHHVDFVMGSWFTSTHPDSLFVRSKVVSTVAVGKRTLLLDRELKLRAGATVETQTLDDDAAYLEALREHFGIDLGPGALLRW